jgi:transposase
VGYNFLPYGCDQDFLLPPDARDWLPPGHLSWAVVDAVGELDLGAFLAYYRSDGKGRPACHPKMMTSLVLYCYCKGIRSSRAVETACLGDVGCRVITGNLAVDHATVARFVCRHRDALTGLFVQVLAVCAREGLVTAGLVAGDGTKVKASASKASSRTLEELDVSIGELQKALEAEVSAWWRQADLLDEQEDSEPDAADAASGVPAAAGKRKRTAGRPARAQQAREMLTGRHGDTSGAVTALEQARQRAGRPRSGWPRKPPPTSRNWTATRHRSRPGPTGAADGQAGRPSRRARQRRSAPRGPGRNAPPRHCSARSPTRTRATSPRAAPPARTAGSCRPAPAVTCAAATCRDWPTTSRSSWRCRRTTTRSTPARCTRC